jgi:uncharacterized membrane protein YozB (DUF420 family)
MDLLSIFPHLNASLNALSACFLLTGFVSILKRDAHRHRACMLAAASLSAVFLVSYITFHTLRTYYFGLGPTRFTGAGLARPIYLTVLTSHTVLAAAIAPFVVLTLWRALKGKFDRHRRLARLVFPIWIYVSITGVIVYLMLYQLFPAR